MGTAHSFAQSVGSISGTVMDASKASIPGAVVTARNEGTGAVREGVTDAAGRYTFPLLPIGTYTVTATMDGFRTQELSKVPLEVAASLTMDFVLEISAVASEVIVSSVASMVELQRSDANLGQLINAQRQAMQKVETTEKLLPPARMEEETASKLVTTATMNVRTLCVTAIAVPESPRI